MAYDLVTCYPVGMPTRKSSPPETGRASAARTWSSLWRLFFAVDYNPPRNIFDVRRRRYRASFFFLLGVVVTLAVQAFLGKLGE